MRLCGLALRFSAVFRILSGLREIRVRILQHGILIAVPELSLQAGIALSLVVFRLGRALLQILIRVIVSHDSTFAMKSGGAEQMTIIAPPLKNSLFLAQLE